MCKNELLLIKGDDGGSVIQALDLANGLLSEKWTTIRTQGTITDFSIKDFKNSAIRSLVMLTSKTGPFIVFSGARSIIYAFDLTP